MNKEMKERTSCYRTFEGWTLERVKEYFGEMEHGGHNEKSDEEMEIFFKLWDDIQMFMDNYD